MAAACAYAAAALALGAAAALGDASAPVIGVVGCCALFVALGAACLARDFLPDGIHARCGALRIVVPVLAAPVGYYLMERPWNTLFPHIAPLYALAGMLMLAAVFALVYLAAQRTRAAIALFWSACLLCGVANHFVLQFKGQPIIPSDVLAFSTAMQVGSEYRFVIDARLLKSAAVFAAALALLAFVPRKKVRRADVAVNAMAALALLLGCVAAYGQIDLADDVGVKVDRWFLAQSYRTQGMGPCFTALCQDMAPTAPAGYSAQAADGLLAAQSVELPEDGLAAEGPEAVSVVAVMNESFSDLSSFPTLEGTAACPELFYRLAQASLESGTTYVSASGGGTCNSEFEFLTGSTDAFLGYNAYPYVQMAFDGDETLVSYFSNLGYTTRAIHPEDPTNWRRETVYRQLGFDEFFSADDFTGAPRLRGHVTDAATYEKALALLEGDEAPQFIFDVTMQNHGGYESGIDESLYVEVEAADAELSSQLSEYASSIQQSAQDLLDFMEALDALDRPVALCFFGDHQPGFNKELWAETHEGESLSEAGLAEEQECWNTPYLIWANASARDVLRYGDAPLDYEELHASYPRSVQAGVDEEGAGGEGAGDGGQVDEAIESEAAPEALAGEDAQAGDEPQAGEAADADGAQAAGEAEGSQEARPSVKEQTLSYTSHSQVTSLNYLGERLTSLLRLPLTPYQSALREASEEVPAVNINGYLDADGKWHGLDEADVGPAAGEGSGEGAGDSVGDGVAESPETQALAALETLQYDNLYNHGLFKSGLWYMLR